MVSNVYIKKQTLRKIGSRVQLTTKVLINWNNIALEYIEKAVGSYSFMSVLTQILRNKYLYWIVQVIRKEGKSQKLFYDASKIWVGMVQRYFTGQSHILLVININISYTVWFKRVMYQGQEEFL